jgi:hypothetical protein
MPTSTTPWRSSRIPRHTVRPTCTSERTRERKSRASTISTRIITCIISVINRTMRIPARILSRDLMQCMPAILVRPHRVSTIIRSRTRSASA